MKDLTGARLSLEAGKEEVALPAPILPHAAGQLPDPEEGEDQPVCWAASGSEAILWESKQPTMWHRHAKTDPRSQVLTVFSPSIWL